MRRLLIGAVVLLTVAVAEVALLVLLARELGLVWAVLLMVVTTPVGGWLLRREGVRGWRRLRAVVDAGRPPGRVAVEGLLGLVAAVLLILPGLLTDLVGLVLLVPPVRAVAAVGAGGLAQRWLSPLAAGDLFGPRRVRTSRGSVPPPEGASEEAGEGRAVVEGEIVSRRARRPGGDAGG